MKNILSKIGKSLLIPALAFSLNTKDANSQKLEFKPIVSVGIGTTNQSKFNVYEEWETHFKGLNGDEQLINKEDRKSTRLNSSHTIQSRMPSSA